MKTNHIAKLGAGLVMAFSFASCTSYLDRDPLGTYTKDNIQTEENTDENKYTTKAHAVTLMNSCYEDLKGEYFQFDQFQIQETCSDNAYAGGNDLPTIQLDYFKYDALNSVIKRDWKYMYTGIAKANAVIQFVPNIKDPELTATEKTQMVGQAKFFRAYYYYILTAMWGEVPLVLKVAPNITADNINEVYPILYPSKASQTDVFAQIEKDLTEALPAVLPADAHAANKSIITAGTVNALLAKVYATQHKYDQTIAACQAVISAGYQLLPDFASLWDLSNEHSAESILEVNFTADAGNWTEWILFDFLLTSQGNLDWQRFCTPTHTLIDNFIAESDNIRLAQTVYTGRVSWDVHWPADNYKFPFKIRNKANNLILFRLADILLLKAEAHAAKGQTSEAMALVNQVRARVSLPAKTATTAEAASAIVLKERQLELAFEGHRWFDLLRTGKAIEIMDQSKDKTNTFVYRGQLAPFRLIFPIPQSELDINVNLTQNPGY